MAGDSNNLTNEDYLRAALRERLAAGAPSVVFDFQVQVRKASELTAVISTQIEDACVEWDQTVHPASRRNQLAAARGVRSVTKFRHRPMGRRLP